MELGDFSFNYIFNIRLFQLRMVAVNIDILTS